MLLLVGMMNNKGNISMTYYKGSQAEYNKKCLQFKAQYRLSDINDGQRLKAYLEKTGQSANSYIKGLIKSDLDSKGFMIDD